MSNQENDKIQEAAREAEEEFNSEAQIDLRDLVDLDKDLIDKLAEKMIEKERAEKVTKIYDFDMVKQFKRGI